MSDSHLPYHAHAMASVNQRRAHCVNQMAKTHSKPLAAWHGRGTAWAPHAMCESALTETRPRAPTGVGELRKPGLRTQLPSTL